MNYHATFAKMFFITILILSTFIGISAAEGDLDPTFDGDGILTNNAGSTVSDIVIQPDGKIVASANSIIMRFNSDGSIDPSFGTSGIVNIPPVSTRIKLALQSDGKFVLAASQNSDVFVARLNSDGSFDTTFNGTGTITYDLRGTGDSGRAVSVLPDGKIVVGGGSTQPSDSSNTDFAVSRLNANGSLDATFGSGGKVFTTIQDTTFISDLVIQTDGKIVAVGESTFRDIPNNNIYGSFATVRYNSDGSLDTSFNEDGIDLKQFDLGVPSGTRTSHTPSKVLIRTGEKILVVGTSSSTIPFKLSMIQYNPDGTVDTTFGDQGKVTTGYPNHSRTFVNDAAIQSDNKIVITGSSQPNHKSFNTNSLIGRFNPDGSPDETINGTGWKRLGFSDDNRNGSNAVAIQPDGRTVIGGSMRNNGQNEAFLARFITTDCQVNCPIAGSQNVFDFDGDGRTDASIFRNGNWFIQPTSANNQNTYYIEELGQLTDKLVPADYDGDGKTDVAVWRENVSGDQAFFYILQSQTNTLRTYQFGNTGDDPGVVGDWDGDGKADLAVYRQAANAGEQSLYYYIPSSAADPFYVVIPWGTSEDEAVRGDFDGDGKSDAAVYRPSNGVWYILNSSNNQPTYTQWGNSTDLRTTGEFDGDGKSDLVIFRDGVWYVLQSSNNQPRYEYWGLAGNHLVPGDYDGDGLTDFAVWKDGIYYILQNSDSQVVYQQFGVTGDIPVASSFVR